MRACSSAVPSLYARSDRSLSGALVWRLKKVPFFFEEEETTAAGAINRSAPMIFGASARRAEAEKVGSDIGSAVEPA